MAKSKSKTPRNVIAVVMTDRFKHTGGPMRDRRERRMKDSRRDSRREEYLLLLAVRYLSVKTERFPEKPGISS